MSASRELEQALAQAPVGPERVDLQNRLSELLIGRDRTRSLALAEDACALAQALPYPVGYAAALRNRAACRLIRAELSQAEADYKTALALCQEHQARSVEASCLQGLSLLCRKAARYPEAMLLLLDARRIRCELEEPLGECAVLNNLGVLCIELGNFVEAELFLQRGIRLAQAYQSAEHELFCRSSMAWLQGQMGQHEAAKSECVACLAFARDVGNTYIQPHLLSHLAEIYLQQKQVEAALQATEEGLTLAEKGEDRQVELTLLLRLGAICAELGLPTAAVAAFERARARTELLGDQERHLEVLFYYGRFALAHEVDFGIQLLHEAREKAESMGAHRLLLQILQVLVRQGEEAEYRVRCEQIEAQLQRQAEEMRRLADLNQREEPAML